MKAQAKKVSHSLPAMSQLLAMAGSLYSALENAVLGSLDASGGSVDPAGPPSAAFSPPSSSASPLPPSSSLLSVRDENQAAERDEDFTGASERKEEADREELKQTCNLPEELLCPLPPALPSPSPSPLRPSGLFLLTLA